MCRSGSPSHAPRMVYVSSLFVSTLRSLMIVPMETRDVSTFSNEVPRALCSICSSSALRRISTLCICLAALNSKFSLRSPNDLASAISLLFAFERRENRAEQFRCDQLAPALPSVTQPGEHLARGGMLADAPLEHCPKFGMLSRLAQDARNLRDHATVTPLHQA